MRLIKLLLLLRISKLFFHSLFSLLGISYLPVIIVMIIARSLKILLVLLIWIIVLFLLLEGRMRLEFLRIEIRMLILFWDWYFFKTIIIRYIRMFKVMWIIKKFLLSVIISLILILLHFKLLSIMLILSSYFIKLIHLILLW